MIIIDIAINLITMVLACIFFDLLSSLTFTIVFIYNLFKHARIFWREADYLNAYLYTIVSSKAKIRPFSFFYPVAMPRMVFIVQIYEK